MGFKQVTKILLGLLILYDLTRSIAFGQSSATDVKPLDVMLLIDSSPSTKSTDPNNLRVSAARFLIDYLEATSEVLGVNFRAGTVNFGGIVKRNMPLRPVQGGVVRDSLSPEYISYTDFRPPLDFALKEFHGRSVEGNAKAVILFTDGNPELSESLSPLSSRDKECYFKGDGIAGDPWRSSSLNKLADSLRAMKAKLFVVAVGASPDNAGLWRNVIKNSGQYRAIQNTNSLPSVYHSFIDSLTGFTIKPEQVLSLGLQHEIMLPPYLDQVIFSFIKDNLDAKITLIDPDGNTVRPRMGEWRKDLHEIYSISDPHWDRPWKIRCDGGGARLWIDQRMPTLDLKLPTKPLILGRPLNFNASLLKRQTPIVDARLQLRAIIKVPPEGKERIEFMERQLNGEYKLLLADLKEPGIYHFAIAAYFYDKPLSARFQIGRIGIFPIPNIEDFWVERDSIAGPLFTARISFFDRIESRAPVVVRIFNAEGKEVDKIELQDDGVSPDSKAGDGDYAAFGPMLEMKTDYSFECVIEGLSRDELPYHSKFISSYIQPSRKLLPPHAQVKGGAWPRWIMPIVSVLILIFTLAILLWLYINKAVKNARIEASLGNWAPIAKLENMLYKLRRYHLSGLICLNPGKSLEEGCRDVRSDFIDKIIKDPGVLSDQNNREVTSFFNSLVEDEREVFEKDQHIKSLSKSRYWSLFSTMAKTSHLKRVAFEHLANYFSSLETRMQFDFIAEAIRQGIMREFREFLPNANK